MCLYSLQTAGTTILKDGGAIYLDITFVERLWRFLKYEAVYLHEVVNGHAVKGVIVDGIYFYNHRRPQTALDGITPDVAYEPKEK